MDEYACVIVPAVGKAGWLGGIEGEADHQWQQQAEAHVLAFWISLTYHRQPCKPTHSLTHSLTPPPLPTLPSPKTNRRKVCPPGSKRSIGR
jgi:hypothetical protein